MSSILSLNRLPSRSPPYLFTDARSRKLLSAASSWFLHSRETGRVHGPFHKKETLTRTTLSGPWRRGIAVNQGFYVPLDRKTSNLSAGQEKCLLADLSLINNPPPVPDVARFSLSGTRLRVIAFSHKPFRCLETSCMVDPIRLRRLSSDALSSLLLIRRSGLRVGLADLEEAGRRIFKTIIRDRELERFLDEGFERPLLIVPDSTMQSVPLELLFSSDFLCLTRPLSRCAENFRPEPAACGQDPKVFQILFAGGKSLPSSEAGLPVLFGDFKKTFEIRQATPKNLPGIMARPGAVHFAGHGVIRKRSYFWQNADKTVLLDPSPVRTPEFILSHACNRGWFSGLFSDFLSGLSASGTDCWVGAWSDIDLTSPVFSEMFYGFFLKGLTAAEALLQTRRELKARNAKESLLFGCWGDPMKKITF